MRTFETILAEINTKLTGEQIQLLKDAIRCGSWGDCSMNFVEDGKDICTMCYGYCTNDAKCAGHFTGRKISAMFRSIYNKLGMAQRNGSGENDVFAHVTDWWGDGSGDMFFIRSGRQENNGVALYEQFEEWARA